jgi:hypothetical protein
MKIAISEKHASMFREEAEFTKTPVSRLVAEYAARYCEQVQLRRTVSGGDATDFSPDTSALAILGGMENRLSETLARIRDMEADNLNKTYLMLDMTGAVLQAILMRNPPSPEEIEKAMAPEAMEAYRHTIASIAKNAGTVAKDIGAFERYFSMKERGDRNE